MPLAGLFVLAVLAAIYTVLAVLACRRDWKERGLFEPQGRPRLGENRDYLTNFGRQLPAKNDPRDVGASGGPTNRR